LSRGPVVLNVRGHEAGIVPLDGDVVFAPLCPGGTAAQGVGAGGVGAADGDEHADVLPGAEGGQGPAVRGFEDDGLGIGAIGTYLGYHNVLFFRVHKLCLFIGLKGFRQRKRGGGLYGRLAVFGQILELQHVQLADKTDLNIQRHFIFPPLPSSAQGSAGPSCCRRRRRN